MLSRLFLSFIRVVSTEWLSTAIALNVSHKFTNFVVSVVWLLRVYQAQIISLNRCFAREFDSQLISVSPQLRMQPNNMNNVLQPNNAGSLTVSDGATAVADAVADATCTNLHTAMS